MKKLMVLLIAIISALSFTACKKEPIVGYEPEIPEEWYEEAEREKNNPNTEIVKTTAFDGVWQKVSTGEFYYFYNGHIFEVDSPDDSAEAPLWGTVVILQNVLKEEAADYEAKIGYEPGEEYIVHISSSYSEISEVKLVGMEGDRVKTILPDGKENVYKFVKTVEVWPEGFNM